MTMPAGYIHRYDMGGSKSFRPLVLFADRSGKPVWRWESWPPPRPLADVHHHREADYLGRTVEIPERILHRCKLRNAAPRLKPI